MSSERAGELADNLNRLERRIGAACRAAGRDRAEVTLVAVTKTFPADDIRRLVELGVTDIGENRDQEARAKADALAGLPIRWHFVGQLQTNKCASVASYAALVHSVDRPRLVDALAAGTEAAGRRIEVCVQVGLDETAAGRGGAAPDAVPVLAAQIARTRALRLRGVMAVAPLGTDPVAAFARLQEVAQSVRRDHPDATAVSAGMSGDLEAAIAAGATHVRIGTALLGGRSPRVR